MKIKITAWVDPYTFEEIIVDEKDYSVEFSKGKGGFSLEGLTILENEQYYLMKRMGKKYGKSVSETEWEEVK